MMRTKSPYPHFYPNWGGHLPFPQEDCPHFDRSFVDEKSGMRWLDIGFCNGKDAKKQGCPCARLRAYKKDECMQEIERLTAIRKEQLRG